MDSRIEVTHLSPVKNSICVQGIAAKSNPRRQSNNKNNGNNQVNYSINLLEAKLVNIKTKLLEVKKRNKILEEKNSELESSERCLQTRVSSLEKDLLKEQKKNKSKKDEVSELTGKIQQLSSIIDSEKDNAYTAVKSLQNQQADYYSLNATFQLKVQQLQESLNHHTQKISSLEAHNNSLRLQLEQKANEFELLRKENITKLEKIPILESKVLEAERESKIVQDQFETEKAKTIEANLRVENLEVKYLQFKQSYEEVKLSKNKNVENAEFYKKVVEESKHNQLGLEKILEQKKQELCNSSTELMQLKSRQKQQDDNLKRKLSENAALIEKLEHSQSESKILAKKLKDLRDGYNKQISEKYEEQCSRNSLLKKNTQSSSKYLHLKDQFDFSEKLRNQLEYYLSRLVTGVPNLLKTIDSLRDKCSKLEYLNINLQTVINRTKSSDDDQNPEAAVRTHEWVNTIAASTTSWCSQPYSIDLLSGYVGLDNFKLKLIDKRSVLTSTSFKNLHEKKKIKKGAFRVRKKTGIDSDNDIFDIVSQKWDTNGKKFLNRCNINLFLKFSQSKAAESRFKALTVSKIVELLNQLRDVILENASLKGYYDKSISLLKIEIQKLEDKLKRVNIMNSSNASPKRNLIRKILKYFLASQINLKSKYTDGNVFITQQCDEHQSNLLQLDGCGITDNILQEIFSAISRQSISIDHLNFENNQISDIGASIVANFINNKPCVKSVNIGNNSISMVGAISVQDSLMNNPQIIAKNLNKNGVIEGYWDLTTSQSDNMTEVQKNTISIDFGKSIGEFVSDTCGTTVNSLIDQINSIPICKDAMDNPDKDSKGSNANRSKQNPVVHNTTAKRSHITINLRKNLYFGLSSQTGPKTKIASFAKNNQVARRIYGGDARVNHVGRIRSLQQRKK